MKYIDPVYQSDHEAQQDALSDDTSRASCGLVYLALYGEYDRLSLELIIMSRVQSDQLKGVCCVCFGHVARRFGTLSQDVLKVLRDTAASHADSDVRGMALDALEVFNIPTGSINTLD